MFGKKKKNNTPQIDQEQLTLIQTAQKRIKQKKRLYYHFIIFLIGSAFLVVLNVALGFGADVRLFNTDWFVWAILIWLFIFMIHIVDVYITSPFLGKSWEDEQLKKLVAKQEYRIEKLTQSFIKAETKIAKEKAQKAISAIKSKNKSSELTIIVAAAENDAIGKDNTLIWHLSDDLKRFKKLTSGHHIIMGRKTFESFPKPLPNRTHVVITRQKNYEVPKGVIVVHSLQDAIDASRNDSQPFIIGGGEIYKQALLVADKIELTRVHHEFEADTFFPKINLQDWIEVSNTFHQKNDTHDYDFSFITYERNS